MSEEKFTLVMFINQTKGDEAGEIEPFAHFANISLQELGGYFAALQVLESDEPFAVYEADLVDVDSLVLSR